MTNSDERNLEPGELRPEIAHAMGEMANLNPKSVVLDPFANLGAVVRECIDGFHCQEVIAVEHNEHLIPHLKSINGLIAKQGDAARLPHITSRSVDCVMSEMLWRESNKISPEHLRHIYFASLQQMERVLHSKGCAVLLERVEFFPQVVAEAGFKIEKTLKVQIDDQQITIYKLIKLET